MAERLPARLYGPRYWPTWLALGLLRLSALLPFGAQLVCGRWLGRLAWHLMRPQRGTVRRNLELCMPGLGAQDRERLARRHFESLGIGLFETANAWWLPDEAMRRRGRLEGLEHLEAALGRGRGALLLGAHFTTTETAVRFLAMQLPLSVMYRPSSNALLAEFLRRNRSRRLRRAIPRDDIRTLVGALKGNECVWYAPDQSYRKKGAQMARLFGIPAATNVATSRLARMTGAAVLPYFVERLPGTRSYRAVIHPALEDFPGDSPVADAERINRGIEDCARRVPDQYLWVHRRFKSIEPGAADPYA
ncbi:MAG: hypothetical protein IPI06_13585 [Gammaproteobacteria bacterium]|nr:hypothetical protein [Gammaproteobacteria bacterium]